MDVWQQVSFEALPGWYDQSSRDINAALDAFLRSSEAVSSGLDVSTKHIGVSADALHQVMKIALRDRSVLADEHAARSFFETHFQPWRLVSNDQKPATRSGLLTGYYEPVLPGSRVPSHNFPVPLYRRPPELEEIKRHDPPVDLPMDWPADLRFGRRTSEGWVPFYDRAAIEGTAAQSGILEGRKLELVWLQDYVEAFFVHIQGSACILLEDGTRMRVSFDGKSGHDYTAIGSVLKAQGALPRPSDNGRITMDSIKSWLRENSGQQRSVMQKNRSFIFFKEEASLDQERGPRAAAGVQLTAGKSLAVDRTLHTFHTPIYISVENDDDVPNGLMIAQDTGSAIVGAQRGDWFAGSGKEAGQLAGRLQLGCEFAVLVPRIQGSALKVPKGPSKV